MTEINSLNPAVTAADYLISALGLDGARLAMIALRADWLTPTEAKSLEPVAVSLAYLLREECPQHRGSAAGTKVAPTTPGEVSEAIVAHLYGDEADAKLLRKFGPETGN